MTDISQDPFVNEKATERERQAYDAGIRQGIHLSSEKIKKVGLGMWDHIALIIKGFDAQ
jgi:hypothetical protein